MDAGRCGMLLFSMIAILLIISSKISANKNETDSFATEYHKWERLYLAESKFAYFAETSLNAANKKFNDIARYDNHFNDSVKYPVIIVNLYTQELPGIFQRVNTQLLTGNVDIIWQKYAYLLSKAIDILSPLVNKRCQRYTVYRGQGCHPIADVEQTFTFGRFLSTTFNPRVALIYSYKDSFSTNNCSTVIKIENATGLPIILFSSFAIEEEVIIKHDALMYVKAKFNDTEQNNDTIRDMINREAQNLLPESNLHTFIHPDVLVYLEMMDTSLSKADNNTTAANSDMDKVISKRSLDDDTMAANLDMNALFNDEDSWKEHLKAEYDGKDSQGVPPCIDATHITSGMAKTGPCEFTLLLLVLIATLPHALDLFYDW